MAALSTQRVMVYLTGSRDWDNWLPVAKAYAQSLEIWGFVNPDIEESTPLPTEPPTPSVSQVKAGATAITDLTEATQLTQYGYLREIWKEENKKYEKIKQGLSLFRNYLHSTIDANKIIYFIKNNDSLHSIMKTLKTEYSISIKTHQKDILD